MAYPPRFANNNGYEQFQSTESFVPYKESSQQYSSQFEDKPEPRMSRKRKALIIGVAIFIVAIIAGGVSAGVAISRANSAKFSASGSSASTGAGVSSSPNAGSASNFQKNAALHQSMAGLCYTPPFAANYPNCGDTIEGVVEDIQLMSQLTKSLRLYGSDCNTSSLVLDAIQRTGVDMTVFLGLYFDDTPGTFERQLGEINTALLSFGAKNVDGIVVGNEVILDAFNAISPSGTPTAKATAAQLAAQKIVIANIETVRKNISALNLANSPKIGTGDAGSMITKQLGAASDFVFANIHAFFSNNVISASPGWTWDYLENGTPASAATASNHPIVYAAEVGWPGSLTLNGSAASMENMQYMLDNYVCAANTNQTRYFWFEAFDEAWKVPLYGGAEGHWGIFNSDRTLKNITIPDCAVTVDMATA